MRKNNYPYTDKYLKNISLMSDEETEKRTIVSDAIAKRYDSEARKESQLKMRILFERTAPEMLPFVIYCLTFAPIATYSLFKIMDLKGTPEFYWGLFGLLIIMVLPIFLLPKIPFREWFTKKLKDS